MIYASILAGGSGQRMQTELPKQFIKINNKPIFIYSIEAFAANPKIDHILLAVSEEYFNHAKSEILKYCPNINVSILIGGNSRHSTLINILDYIKQNLSISKDTILITHDAARPFLDDRIICENINAAKLYGACTTAINTTDTIFKSDDACFAHSVTKRQNLYNIQTPQSFNFNKLYEFIHNLTHEESKDITDACSIFILKGQKVALIKGRPENIKITYPQDIIFANDYAKTLKNTNNKP